MMCFALNGLPRAVFHRHIYEKRRAASLQCKAHHVIIIINYKKNIKNSLFLNATKD